MKNIFDLEKSKRKRTIPVRGQRNMASRERRDSEGLDVP